MASKPYLFPVTPDKFATGINHVSDPAVEYKLVTYEELLNTRWTSPAHFACYAVRAPGEMGLTEKPYPRINKAAVSSIREVGGELFLIALVLDFDLKDQEDAALLPLGSSGKPVWTPEAKYLFRQEMIEIGDALSKRGIGRPDIYTTTHGARFIHLLTNPVVVEEAECRIRGLIKIYEEHGVILDPLCDWTRLFAAPQINKTQGNPTWATEWFQIWRSNETTNPNSVPYVEGGKGSTEYGKLVAIDASMPSPEEAHDRLWTTRGARTYPTDMHKFAKSTMRHTDAFPVLFENTPLAEEGSRDSTLIRLVGLTAAYLIAAGERENKTIEPEDIYALFLPSVEQLVPDAGTPNWNVSLWTKVCGCVAKERAKHTQIAEERKQQAVRAKFSQVDMIAAARASCMLPELHDEDEVVAMTALKRLMLIHEPSGRFRAMRRDGAYTDIAVPQGSLHFLIEKAAGISDMCELFFVDKKGDVKPVPENALARYATSIKRIEGSVGIKHNQIRGKRWDDLTLDICLYRRNPDLKPTFHAGVDEWLNRLTTEPDKLKRWISRALEFEGGPICALSLAGASGAGKGMLAQGLIECLEVPMRADKSALVRNFNASLAGSPFLVVDEGLPAGVYDIADSFRSMTAGEPLTIEEKFQTPITVRNPLRIIFMANNLDVLTQLASNRLNDNNDQEALAVRILHLTVKDESARYLEALGGLSYTKGWVQGAAGAQSNFVLAKHFLHLYEQREKYGPPDSRFLVEGQRDSEIIQSLRVTGRFSQAIVRAILEAIEDVAPPVVKMGVSFEDDRLCITVKAIEEQLKLQRTLNSSISAQIAPSQIAKSLRNLITDGTEPGFKKRKTSQAGTDVNLRWYDIDLRLMHDFADRAGYNTTALEILIEKNKAKAKKWAKQPTTTPDSDSI